MGWGVGGCGGGEEYGCEGEEVVVVVMGVGFGDGSA